MYKLGCLDTFPIRIRRSKERIYRKSTQNGKYKAYVLKYQIACDLTGRIIWYSGPHAGCQGDPLLWTNSNKENEMNEYECWLADKVYSNKGKLVVPPKRLRSQNEISIEGQCINELHTYYRVTIEHVIGFVKRQGY